jgi:RNA methyltransferase, TrmH family
MKSRKDYQKLHMKKYRDEWKLFSVEGARLCREALHSGWPIEAAFCNESFFSFENNEIFAEQLKNIGIQVTLLKEDAFKRLADTEHPQGILLIVAIPVVNGPTQLNFSGNKLVLILDGIRDPGNMGTLIRSADWFGVNLVISSPDSVDYFNSKVVRASMGSIFHVKLSTSENITETLLILKAQKFQIISTSLNSNKSLTDVRIQSPIALILGGETAGVSHDRLKIADENITISGYGRAESLNVSVAGGILLQSLADEIFSHH